MSVGRRLGGFALAALVTAGALPGCTVTEPAVPGVVAASLNRADKTPPSDDTLNGEVLYKLLVGELASHRGDMLVALENYLEVARETRDAGVAARATKLAMFAHAEERGLEAARLWTEADPSSVEGRQVLASLLIQAGEIDEAVEHLARIVEMVPEPPGAGYHRVAEILGAEKDTEAAVAVMRQLLRGHEDSAEIQLALARLLVRTGDVDESEEAVDRARELEPGNARAAVLKARLRQRADDIEGALRVLEDFIELVPASATARMVHARMLVDARRYEQARAEFEHLVAEEPENDDARYALGLLLVQTNRLEEATRQFKRLANRESRRDAAHYYLGRIAEARQDPDAALASYDRVLRGDNRMNAQLRTAVLLSEAGRVDEARSRLHALHGRNANEVMRLYGVEVDILVRHSRFDDAMEVYDAALEEWPEDANLLYARAMLAVELDDLVTAERDFSAIIERDPNHANALNALGYTLADRTDRLDEAYRLIKRAYELEPDSHYIVDSMGWVMFRMGRFEEALRFLWRAMQLGADPEIAAHLGEVLWTMGDRESARTVWGNALEADPDDKKLLDVKQRFGL
jgi:tetratricopeptide (TPR) repeat protein